MTIQNYKDLDIWKISMDLAVSCYKLTKSFPKNEMFGMTSQIRRSGSSIPANIAEGHGRNSTKEYLHFLSIANGSLLELETHLNLSLRVGLSLSESIAETLNLVDRVGRMMTALRRSLESKITR